jgi:hypothetical protein
VLRCEEGEIAVAIMLWSSLIYNSRFAWPSSRGTTLGSNKARFVNLYFLQPPPFSFPFLFPFPFFSNYLLLSLPTILLSFSLCSYLHTLHTYRLNHRIPNSWTCKYPIRYLNVTETTTRHSISASKSLSPGTTQFRPHRRCRNSTCRR